MNLSDLVSGGRVPDYIEFAWTCPLSAGPQDLTRNDINILQLTEKLWDTGNHGSLNTSTYVFTLNSGIYYFEAQAPFGPSNQHNRASLMLGLYNDSTNRWVTRDNADFSSGAINDSYVVRVNGQFKIDNSTDFTLRGVPTANNNNTIQIYNHTGYVPDWQTALKNVGDQISNQRTTIKLWKLK